MNRKVYCFLFLFVLPLLLSSCGERAVYTFSAVTTKNIKNYSPGFKEYSKLDLSSDFERNAVLCSFYGDYKNTLNQAAKREAMEKHDILLPTINGGNVSNSEMLKQLSDGLKDPNSGEETKALIRQAINIFTAPTAEEVFSRAKPTPAVNYIAERARAYHYTLINEAHYNSLHRSFTKDLLAPLWNEGYRYLALEALGYQDKALSQRGYPIMSTGYYIKDSSFGNLVREAIKIGYQLIAYESQGTHGGTLRDSDQANNIIERTWQKDQQGKVLIHAGYSHISEQGDSNYEPMGYQLKTKMKQDILTIDQISMIGLNDTAKVHPYYREATRIFPFREPTIFLGQDGAIVDPLHLSSIDIQVYHPITRFEQGRPQWLKNKATKQVVIPPQINTSYHGCLIQAVGHNEVTDAVPIDQFVIGKGIAFMLPAGKYELRIVDREGILIGLSKLKVR